MNTLCVELNKGEFLYNKLVRVEKGWKLRFVRGENLHGKVVQLRILETDFAVGFPSTKTIYDLDSTIFHDYSCDIFGTYKYEFFENLDDQALPIGCGYFCIVPEWEISDGKKTYSLNSLSIITHITKLLGPIKDWESRFLVIKESGYNMIHLTPVQKLGISNSSYSIAEYDQPNPLIGEDFAELENFIKKIEDDWHILTIQDVVLNHAAKNAKWLQEHPECAYNCFNTPHMRPAYILDRVLQQFSREISEGEWESKGLPALIDTDNHLNALRCILEDEIFPNIRLQEFFQIDVDKLVLEFSDKLKECQLKANVSDKNVAVTIDVICFVQDNEFRRFGSTIDFDGAQKFYRTNKFNNAEEAIQHFRDHLDQLNAESLCTVNEHIAVAINAIIGHVLYERVAEHGRKLGKVVARHPLVTNYFLHPKQYEGQSWFDDEKLAYDPSTAPYLMACNGWIMNADPLINFAEWPSQVYLRRELVCWGDCVKLNYGKGPEDCPYLWDYMQKYVEKCAKIFHGFRIDNCHSTPIHVAEYLLTRARRIRKELYVVAELFTGGEQIDNIFVNRLGITSLIREAQNAPDSHEQGRFVYRYGGDPVGTFHCKSTRPAPWAVAHALFYDQTHDNPTPFQKRTVYDYLPTAAMCEISYCACGTVRGYDEFVPHNIDVVHEARLYRKLAEITPEHRGMLRARFLLNDLHYQACASGFSEIFVDQVNENIVAVTRHNPKTHESILLISHTCFSIDKFRWRPECRPLFIDDDISAILFELKTVEEPNQTINGPVTLNTDYITGLPNFRVECYENVQFDKSDAIQIKNGFIHFKLFVSGSVVAIKINPKNKTKKACSFIEQLVSDEIVREEARKVVSGLELADFNFLLFRCEPEELFETGTGTYEIPSFKKLPYCGLQGIRSILQKIQEKNDLGHPFCENLRRGTWLIDYSINRLKRCPKLAPLVEIFKKSFNPLNDVPHYLRPCYFELVFTYFFSTIEEVLLEKIFVQAQLPRIKLTEMLCISSNAFVGKMANALLAPLANEKSAGLSISAGLPHFAEGIWRNWGRDTFIALPGLLLLTGRFKEAHAIILSFAGTLRHGLIPNLLAEGKAPRYNCRDAVWFWLVSIVRYAEMAKDGEQIFKEPVLRLYPTDETKYGESRTVEPLHATVYEALSRHFAGINFCERNKGPMIDEHMRDEGFNVCAYIDHDTGLVFGGNRWNCGTWMDKMGSSHRAGNRGEPATPRDGAAVELQGLALRVARALNKYSNSDVFPYPSLKVNDLTWTWAEWANKIERSFGEKFFIDDNSHDKFVNRRGIIKDTFDNSLGYTDYQLRPNFCIALDVVPDIIEPEKAWSAMKIAGEVLAANAPLGICTLDPTDWAYRGDYNNDDDGTIKETAKGWNYHQGPEWVWVACFYMSAKLKVASLLARKTGDMSAWHTTLDEVRARLFRYENTMHKSDWSSLPELTNRDGKPCPHSCPAQAWSIGCALETVKTLQELLDQMG